MIHDDLCDYGVRGIQAHALQGLSLTVEEGEFSALAGPSAKREDFRVLAMNINVFFEGRWEKGLLEAEQLHDDYPAYLRLALAPAVMRLFAPGMAARYAALAAAADSATAGLRPAARDSATLWTVRTSLAWTERFLRFVADCKTEQATSASSNPTEK